MLPVVWARAADELARALERERPELVVCFGQADGRAHVEIERFALNFDDGTDEDGRGAPGRDRLGGAGRLPLLAAGGRARGRAPRGGNPGSGLP